MRDAHLVRFSRRYFAAALMIFGIEVFIALAVHDRFIRPFVGDVLVVVLIYCFVRSFLATPPRPTAICVLAFACLIELAQFFQLVTRLGLRHHAILRTAIGTHFDPLDLLAYALGTAAIVWAEHRIATRVTTSARPPAGS